MFGQKSEKDVFCNCRKKIYPDGSTNTTYASRDVFKKAGFEEQHNVNMALEMFLDGGEPLDNSLYNGYPRAPVTEEMAKRHMKKKARDEQDGDGEEQDGEKSPEFHADSMKRAIDSIFDIVAMNDWKYFITGTFNDKIVDGSDSKAILKPVQKWLNNSVTRKGLQYVLVPELHPTSGRIHFHGLVNDALTMTDSGRRMYKGHAVKITTLERWGVSPDGLRTVYNIDDWRFGWSTAIPVDEQRIRMARYVTKYITKDCDKIFGKYFWSSKNILRKPEIEYSDADYDSIAAKEFIPVGSPCAFKYISDFKA